ncbi:MAG: hypothetical protein OMM_09223 [Candidatus Magnetoglobus multicellularis str. Araruama]|uniref:Uncharacterized protein n=1 Tax=Candidatus Magnetoglobus multicellularis str. Araruama TaxID=890399 RepID=A0A1V1P509_9BACT|nr:MAG: hypothetical protein OMM_09223 [Candidatus Magnetoglobus multicellularis str. Araruama]
MLPISVSMIGLPEQFNTALFSYIGNAYAGMGQIASFFSKQSDQYDFSFKITYILYDMFTPYRYDQRVAIILFWALWPFKRDHSYFVSFKHFFTHVYFCADHFKHNVLTTIRICNENKNYRNLFSAFFWIVSGCALS